MTYELLLLSWVFLVDITELFKQVSIKFVRITKTTPLKIVWIKMLLLFEMI